MSADHRAADTLLTLVVTVRSTGEAFDRFLSSLRAQQSPREVDCVFVALGDDVLRHEVDSAVGRAGITARVSSHPSADIAAARRHGVSQATGRWVAFPDGHDALGEQYVAAVTSALEAHGDDVQALAVGSAPIDKTTNIAVSTTRSDLDESLAELPSDITRLVLPRCDVPPSGTSIAEASDELLIIDLLHGDSAPTGIALAEGPLYLKRKRPAPDRQTEFHRSDASHYLALVADVARRTAADESASGWRHQLAIRMLKRLIDFENTTTRRSTVLVDGDGARFREELGALLRGFDTGLFRLRNLPQGFDERRDTLLALSGRTGASPIAHVIKADRAESLMEVRHSVWGEVRPVFSLNGETVEPRYGKRRRLEAFGAEPLEQVIAWVPASGLLRMQADGADVTLCYPDGQPLGADDEAASIEAWRDRRLPGRRNPRQGTAQVKGLVPRARRAVKAARRSWLSRAAAVRLLARAPWVRREFRDAWLLMDRADMGRDNAEHFYRWLSEHHPEINAWYVLRSDSADFRRLSDEGFRMVEYGSLRHQLLLNNTRQYLSSHVGIDVSRPIFDRYLQRDAPWTFTFLQHGVIHNDLSTWLNRQSIRLFLTSTHGEFNSLSGESPYVFTRREMRLTGLPRFDKLRRVADATPRSERRTIVIAPTWRNSLFLPPERTGELRKPRPGFQESPFIQSLLGVLNDDRLRRLSDEGYTIRFVPHPNLAAHFPYEDVPSFVSVTTYAETDVQELIGSAAVFLTDYSSVAFDAAFAGADIVYMHLDGGAIYGQDHTLFPGYFDFERDGFGPVCRSVDEAVDAVMAASAGTADPEYANRARAAFAYWDSGACERVFAAVIGVGSTGTQEGMR